MQRECWPIKGRKAGFTLLELLVALAILGILAGIGFSGMEGVRRLLAKSESHALFQELVTASLLFRHDRGEWPSGLNIHALELNNSDGVLKEALGPYRDRQLAGLELVDGFGNSRIVIAADLDGDRWIHRDQLPGIDAGDCPEALWARVVVYSLWPDGRLAAASWER